jgi:hypothetical protein
MTETPTEGRGCFLALLIACTFLVGALFFFYFKGKDLTWQYLQKGVVERSVLPLLPPDFSDRERREVQAAFNTFFEGIRSERIPQQQARVVIDTLSRATADRRLDRTEVALLLKEIVEMTPPPTKGLPSLRGRVGTGGSGQTDEH